MQLGYCTNVHAGADLETTRANLEEHAVAVKQLFSPDQPMGIGLWLSSEATPVSYTHLTLPTSG